MKKLLLIATFILITLALTGCISILKFFIGEQTQLPPTVTIPGVLYYGYEGYEKTLLVVNDESGKFGYIDTKGNIVIEPKYLSAMPFSEGLAAVKNGYDWGYIDKRGNVVIGFQYDVSGPFRGGHAAVSIWRHENGIPVELSPYTIDLYGLIDSTGKEVMPMENSDINILPDGDIIQRNGQGNMYLLNADLSKKTEFPSGLSCSYNFCEGLAVARDASGGPFGYLDKNGAWAIQPTFDFAWDFSEGLAAVRLSEDDYAFIDHSGNVVIHGGFLSEGTFGQGLACVKTADKGRAFIDTSGKIVFATPDSVDTARSFSEGLCAAGKAKPGMENYPYADDHYTWGFIDISGRLVIDYKYDLVTSFKNGIAEVLINGKIGYIDKTGKYIWEPK